MSNKRFTKEFRIVAVKEITERGYPVKEVLQLDTTSRTRQWRFSVTV